MPAAAVPPSPARQPADLLIHPVTLGALALLLVNDHLLKGSEAPGWLTGKLSDVAGLVCAPLILLGGIEWLASRRRGDPGWRRGLALWVIFSVAAVFVAIQLWPAAARLYVSGIAALQYPFYALARVLSGEPAGGLPEVPHTADPTDLLALLALCLPMALAWRR